MKVSFSTFFIPIKILFNIVGTCGYQLNQKGEIIKQEKAPKKELIEELESNNSEEEQEEEQEEAATEMDKLQKEKADWEIMKMKMVEKGVLQSQQIKENPLTQNLIIGKRGRPPGLKSNGIKK